MPNNMYPMKFVPVLKEMLWGGSILRDRFGRRYNNESVGESWDISCHPKGESIVLNGGYSGISLKEVINKFPLDILGTNFSENKEFPLLLKLIHANDVLSVQVHPTDSYSQAVEAERNGKTEMWYILEAGEGSELVYGLKKGIDKSAFYSCLEKNEIENCLNRIKIKSGDAVFIPAGLIHAIGKNIILCEIQQNSDLTYRVYDWDRSIDGSPRALHIDKALDIIDFDMQLPPYPIPGITIEANDYLRTYLISCKYFTVEKVESFKKVEEYTDGSRFFTLTVVKGQGIIEYSTGNLHFETGDSLLIPANIGNYAICGNCELLKAYVPNSTNEILTVLSNEGYTKEHIYKSIAGLI